MFLNDYRKRQFDTRLPYLFCISKSIKIFKNLFSLYINLHETQFTIFSTLFLMGPKMPGGSCSLSDHVTPLSKDLFIKPLHLSETCQNQNMFHTHTRPHTHTRIHYTYATTLSSFTLIPPRTSHTGNNKDILTSLVDQTMA